MDLVDESYEAMTVKKIASCCCEGSDVSIVIDVDSDTARIGRIGRYVEVMRHRALPSLGLSSSSRQ